MIEFISTQFIGTSLCMVIEGILCLHTLMWLLHNLDHAAKINHISKILK